MKYIRVFVLSFLVTGIVACSQSETKTNNESEATLSQQVDSFINGDEYEKALTLLDSKEETVEVTQLREKTHLNYGIYLIYNADPSTMRENANNALRQFVEVLKINPNNEKAVSEIEQILSIYRSFPDRQPKEEVLNDLRELGFDI